MLEVPYKEAVETFDALRSYFSYYFRSLCGILKIKLEGTPEDWRSLAFEAENPGRQNG